MPSAWRCCAIGTGTSGGRTERPIAGRETLDFPFARDQDGTQFDVRSILWVAADGACGAVLRFGVQAMTGAWPSFPWGTFLVNVAGSLAIGIVIGAFAGVAWFETGGRAFLVAGVLGAFTTFSAFSMDTVLLLEQGRLSTAAAYVIGSVAACLAAALAGYRLVEILQ